MSQLWHIGGWSVIYAGTQSNATEGVMDAIDPVVLNRLT